MKISPRGCGETTRIDAPRDDPTVYGITPAEIRRRFEGTGDWEIVFAFETVFERRWSTNRAYFVGVRRH